MIDRRTSWLEATPIERILASDVADAFVRTWVARFGVPLKVTTDRGTQFESALFNRLSNLLGFCRLRTTGYHPQANGKVERCHRTLKEALRTVKTDWYTALPVALMRLRITPNASGISPFTALTGATMLSPSASIKIANPTGEDAFTRDLAQTFRDLPFTTLKPPDVKSFIPRTLSTCTHAWVRVDKVKTALTAPYDGPFPIVSRGDKFFTLKYPDGHTDTVSIDRLKPVFMPTPRSDEITPEPRRSAREKKSVRFFDDN